MQNFDGVSTVSEQVACEPKGRLDKLLIRAEYEFCQHHIKVKGLAQNLLREVPLVIIDDNVTNNPQDLFLHVDDQIDALGISLAGGILMQDLRALRHQVCLFDYFFDVQIRFGDAPNFLQDCKRLKFGNL